MEETNKELVDEKEIDINATSEVTDETIEEQLELAYEENLEYGDDEVGYIEEVKDEDILKEIAERASSLRADDKKLIRDLSAKYGLEFRPKSRCNECYIEQACKIYALINEAKPTKSGAVDGYQLREGLNVTYNGWHINSDTLTKETAEKWIADGFPLKYFVKVPKETK